MNSQPLVNVVINCFNGEKYIKESIESVINQSYNNWEIIFWDNGSFDQTKNIVNNYQKSSTKIKYFHYKENEKLGIARNKAINECTGKYITFLDVDDIYLNNTLEILVNSIEKENVDLCYGGVENIDEKGKRINRVMPKYKNGNLFNDLLMQFDIHVPSVIVSNKIIKTNKYSINTKLECSEEFNLFMKIAYKHSICSIPKIVSKYRIRSDSLTVLTQERHGIERRITLDELVKTYPSLLTKNRKEMREAYARSKYYDARHFLFNKQKIKGIRILSKLIFVHYKYLSLFMLSLLPNYFWIKIHEIKNKRN
ncbi:MAG: hypothetical protein CMF54_07765 [Legionellales bacterium]|nr:hypothetical protein [Legionellales bacterium]